MAPSSSSGARLRARPVRHRAPQGEEDGHQRLADGPEADQSDAPAADLERAAGDDVDLRPPPGLQLALDPVEVAGDTEQRAQHPLGDGGGVEAGGVRQRHAGGGEGVEVVAGHAHTRLLHEGQPGGVGDGGPVEAGRGEAPVVQDEVGVAEGGGHAGGVVVGHDHLDRQADGQLRLHGLGQRRQDGQGPRGVGHGGPMMPPAPGGAEPRRARQAASGSAPDRCNGMPRLSVITAARRGPIRCRPWPTTRTSPTGSGS